MELPNQEKIRTHGEKEPYKYLGILKDDNIKQMEMKEKKRTYRIVDFAVSAEYWVKWKESEKKYKYLDLARGLKKLWNMKVTV